MRKFVFFLISALVLLFPIYLPAGRQDILAHSETQVIEMTEEGFVPQEVTIDLNSSVIFVNKDSEYRWPASNTHPTHELYPQFDSKHAIKPGKSWVFKPEKIGVWKYHDHLFPHKRGLLVVTEEKREVKSSSEKITVKSERKIDFIDNFKDLVNKTFLSVRNVFTTNNSKIEHKQSFNIAEFKKANYQEQEEIAKNMAKQLGAEKTWQNIKAAFKNESGSSGGIHDLAHLAGNFLYQEKDLSGLKSCSSDFAFGCYHGLLDKAFAKSLNDLNKAEDACLVLGRKNSGPVASCIHGIGHGIASYFLTSDIKKSLSACRKLTSGQEYCFDGVFMEFVRSAPESFYKKEDVLYPCDSLEKDFGYAYSFSCGRNQPSLLMGRFKISFDEVSSICLSSSSKPFKEGCIEALGFHLAGTLDPKSIIEGCSLLGEFATVCTTKAAGELVFQNAPDWKAKSQILCDSLSDFEECLDYVNTLSSEYKRQ